MCLCVAGAFGSTRSIMLPPYLYLSPTKISTIIPVDTPPKQNGDSLRFPIQPQNDGFATDTFYNPFDLQPSNVEKSVEYNPDNDTYTITPTINGQPVGIPQTQSFDEYWATQNQQTQNNYFEQKAGNKGSLLQGSGIVPKLYVGPELFDRLFGGTAIDIRPTGNIEIELGMKGQRLDNPAFTLAQRKQGPNLYFDQNIDVGVVGKIGDKLKINTNYNTKAIFDFAQQIKLEYAGDEDDIIQEIKAGNVNFPLPTTLISGSQNLFGLQTKLKFGKLTINTVLSQQKSKAKSISLENGSQIQNFELNPDDYEENRHFFLSQYFKNNFETWVKQAPYIASPILITRLDVFVNDQRGTPNDVQRDIVALTDLGEAQPYNPTTAACADNSSPLPRNNANCLGNLVADISPASRLLTTISPKLSSEGLQDIRDFRKTNVRKLSDNEFIYDPQLGFITLNFKLNDNEVLAVAYEYVDSRNGQKYRVGDLIEDVFPVDSTKDPLIGFFKMLKTTTPLPKHPIWNLMMKNVYSIGAYQAEKTDFELNVYYENTAASSGSALGGGDIRYIPEGKEIRGIPLIKLLNLDRLNTVNELHSDGVFDMLVSEPFNNASQNIGGSGGGGGNNSSQTNDYKFGTINTKNGRLIFPVLEPFGEHLRKKFEDGNNTTELADKYVYDILYDSTKTIAAEFPELNRFLIKGKYRANLSSEISLGAFNVPEGSINVSAGGKVLIENVDYTVDYNLGRISILNDAIIEAGIPIDVKFEDNASFGLQQRTMIGTRLDYAVNKDFNIGGTAMHLSERPFTRKVNYGEDPISNTMLGLDMKFFKPAPAITKIIDALPLLSTKEPSSVSLYAEGAAFLPGHSKAIGKLGNIYIDDFEGAKNGYNLNVISEWMLASTPENAPSPNGNPLFPEATANTDNTADSLAYGYNRARIAWFQADRSFASKQLNRGLPDYITNSSAQSNHYVRTVLESELFPKKTSQTGYAYLNTFDIHYTPQVRGPYNYDLDGSPFSAGIDNKGLLKSPSSRWGGIMRECPFKDFEAANVEFIEFWVLDPFIYANQQQNSGDLYFNLGNISEDVLKDSRQYYENSLPAPGEAQAIIDTTKWGRVPKIPPISDAFDNDADARKAQDVGYDGLNDEYEKLVFDKYVLAAANVVTDPVILNKIKSDPSNDDFRYFLDDSFNDENATQLERYMYFNNADGNSPIQLDNSKYSRSGTSFPEKEDLNQDNTLSTAESFFQYRIPLKPKNEMEIGKDFLTDYIDVDPKLADPTKSVGPVRWYYFRIPVEEFSNKVGNVNFRNIEGIRMFLTGFKDTTTLRFARLNLVRNNWRKYEATLREEGEYFPNDNASEVFFNVSSVNIEENSKRKPINYEQPPGIVRDQLPTASGVTGYENEQSITLQVGNLPDGESKAIYKTIEMDMRNYKRIKMFVHAETLKTNDVVCEDLKDNEARAFIRIGDDFKANYYEYEIPLKVTLPNDPISPEDIWRTDNEFDIKLQDLVDAKVERNFLDNPNFVKPYIKKIVRKDPQTGAILDTIRVTVVGSPDLGKSKRIMLGVRNPRQKSETQNNDTGNPICAEVWFNELRLSDIDETPGYAAIARMDVKLADFGTLNVTGNMHTHGFGSLEQKIDDRKQDLFLGYDASATLELGKLLPPKSGIKIPMYAGVRENISTPYYDPYDTDVRLKQNMDSIRAVQGITNDSIKAFKKQRQTLETTKSINFTNVHKDRTNTERKPKVYDIENWSATYAYTKTNKQDPIIENEELKRHFGALTYDFNTKPNFIYPFQKLIKSSNKSWAIIKDINFNLFPNKIGFKNELERYLERTQLRQLASEDIKIEPSFNKFFTWNRKYIAEYQLTKSIKINFDALNNAIIDEPEGEITDSIKSIIIDNFKRFGRNVLYTQNANASYNLPINKIPILDWVNIRTSYNTNYKWESLPTNIADTLGNIISNGQGIQVTGEFGIDKLYNKSTFFKKLMAAPPAKTTVKNKEKDKNKKPETPEVKPPAPPKNKNVVSPFVKLLMQPLIMVKRVSLNYTGKRSTIIPGFMYKSQYFGQNFTNKAPGFDFIFGMQPDSTWLNNAANDGWISKSYLQNNPIIQTKNQGIKATAKLEPWRELNIDLNMEVNFNKTHREFFKIDETQHYKHYKLGDEGGYTVSYITWKTMYDVVNEKNISKTYKQFEANRTIISKRLQAVNPNSNGEFNDTITNYRQGYGPYATDVIVPSFIAAYSGTDASKLKNLNPLTTFPLPNWRLTYNGLSKFNMFKNIFSEISISHGYTSTLNINNFTSDLDFMGITNDVEQDVTLIDNLIQEDLGIPSAINTSTGNFYTYYRIPNVSITEQLSPLIGINTTLKIGTTLKFEYKKARTLGMNFQDYQLSESKSEEFIIGAGHKFKDVKMPFKIGKKETEIKGQLSVNCDFSYKKMLTTNYRLDQDISEPTSGNTTIRIAPSVDYSINDKLIISLFYERTKLIPAVSTSFPTVNYKGGIKIKFALTAN